MPRPRTGTIEWSGTRWRARITMPDKSRPWVDLPASIPEDQPELARAETAERVRLAWQLNLGRAPEPAAAPREPEPSELASAWFERWLKYRRGLGMTSARPTESYVSTHVLPALGATPMAAVTRAQLEDLVAALDEKAVAGKLTGKTARNIWGVVSKAFADASGAKRREFRARTDNPALGVAPPEPGTEKVKVYLYPSEFLRLVACPAVPVRWAQLYALATYLYTRPGELEVLDCESVDLAHRAVHLHIARDDLTGDVKELKTGVARHVPIEPELAPLVEVLHKDVGGRGRLVPWFPLEKYLAPSLRVHLELAGVTRAALFARDATRKPLRFYDLRSTGITWCAVRGDEPLRISQRAGHEDFKTTQGYIREAENLLAAFGTPFPPLPARLLESSANRPDAAGETKKPRRSRGFSVVAGVGFEPQQPRETTTVPAKERPNPAPPVVENGPRGHVADDSRTIPANPRAALVAALTAAVRDATAAGDLECARIAHEALGRLLGAAAGEPAPVVDLAERRGGR